MNGQEKGMSLIVKTITRLTVGLILLFGIYIVLHGHISPGGGFAGGVIIALSFIHIMLAFGKDFAFKKINENVASILESIGALIFVTLALTGLGTGYFFFNFLSKGKPFKLFSSGLMPLYNIAITLKVGSGLFIIVVVMVLLKIAKKENNK
ncbi:MAG: MnhB domain-containing protein [Candidatus Omnitrophota bacterium]